MPIALMLVLFVLGAAALLWSLRLDRQKWQRGLSDAAEDDEVRRYDEATGRRRRAWVAPSQRSLLVGAAAIGALGASIVGEAFYAGGPVAPDRISYVTVDVIPTPMDSASPTPDPQPTPSPAPTLAPPAEIIVPVPVSILPPPTPTPATQPTPGFAMTVRGVALPASPPFTNWRVMAVDGGGSTIGMADISVAITCYNGTTPTTYTAVGKTSMDQGVFGDSISCGSGTPYLRLRGTATYSGSTAFFDQVFGAIPPGA